MDFGLKLIEILAWPTVALVAIWILGPGGVLLRFTENLGSSVSNFAKSIPELKSTALTMRSDVETLVSKSREMSAGFSDEFTKIENKIVSLSARLTELTNELKVVIEDIDRKNVIEQKEQINRALEDATLGHSGSTIQLETNNIEMRSLSAEEMYDKIVDVWRDVCEKIKSQIGEANFDGRQIASMARKLADGRRARQLGIRDVELIETLSSQFKRFVRIQSNKEDWLNEDVFNSFLRGAEEAKRALQNM